MPVYEYVAIGQQGRKTKGSLDAENVRAARQRLRSQGIYPTDIKESHKIASEKSKDVKRFFESNRVKIGDLAIATRQLATLVGAGLPIVEALQALADQVETPILKRVVITIREDVQEGLSLAKALARFPKAFPKLYMNMVRAGEASGTLDMVLENLADHLESQQELRRKVTSALFYPALMLVFCLGIVIILLTWVVPTIVDIFIKQGAVLPLPTQILLAISRFITGYWPLMIAMIIGAVALIRFYYRQENGRARIDRLLLRLPLYGSLLLKINSARVSRTLGTLLSNGVGLLESLDIVKAIVSNVHVVRALENARTGVQEGKSLAKELGRSGEFKPMLIHMIGVGEASGRLEGMLVKAGKSYENEVNATLSGLTSLIEPIMMMILGVIVLCIVVSILLPMVDLVNIVQK